MPITLILQGFLSMHTSEEQLQGWQSDACKGRAVEGLCGLLKQIAKCHGIKAKREQPCSTTPYLRSLRSVVLMLKMLQLISSIKVEDPVVERACISLAGQVKKS